MAWVKLVSKNELVEGDVLGLEAGGQQVALYCDKGEYFATSNVCIAVRRLFRRRMHRMPSASGQF
jgi:nitrite reductase/ring-hydroxylating ferredoxin subunit